MRLRDHVLGSVIVGLARYPRAPHKALLVVLAGVLIDIDHLVIYALRTGDWTISGALHYDRYRHRRPGPGDTRPRYGSMRSWLHRPVLVLPPLWWLAHQRPCLQPVALGLSLHLLLDHRLLPYELYARARARGRCQHCGQRAALQSRWSFQPTVGRRQMEVLCAECLARDEQSD